MRLVYFASVREAVGLDGEDRDIAGDVQTVEQCLDWLASLDPRYETAFADRPRLRFALDQQLVAATAPLGEAQELAIFPPVTGG